MKSFYQKLAQNIGIDKKDSEFTITKPEEEKSLSQFITKLQTQIDKFDGEMFNFPANVIDQILERNDIEIVLNPHFAKWLVTRIKRAEAKTVLEELSTQKEFSSYCGHMSLTKDDSLSFSDFKKQGYILLRLAMQFPFLEPQFGVSDLENHRPDPDTPTGFLFLILSSLDPVLLAGLICSLKGTSLYLSRVCDILSQTLRARIRSAAMLGAH